MVCFSLSISFQHLLLDDFEEMSANRLRALLSSMELGMRGDDVLMSEDVIEFTAYLASENEELSQEAINQFTDRFENKIESISEIGQLRRPQVGDLLIDALCDLVIAFCEEIPIREERCRSMLRLIAISSRVCVLRHGLTRLLEMYRWSLSNSLTLYSKGKQYTVCALSISLFICCPFLADSQSAKTYQQTKCKKIKNNKISH